MERNGITFQILVYGKHVKEHPHEGRTYVEGRKGSQYTLRVRNNTASRVLAIVTVDGLSVMNGKQGSYESGGYVLEPHRSIDIPGWRLDNDQVARFFFSEKDQAYAALMDQPSNMGVIGCAVFREKPRYRVYEREMFPIIRPWPPIRYGHGETLRAVGAASKSIGNVGTGFGERTEHRVSEVSFNKEASPMCTIEVHYDDREGLEARGIDLKERPQVATPNPFPGERRSGCTPPRDWNS